MKTIKTWKIAFAILAAFSIASCGKEEPIDEEPIPIGIWDPMEWNIEGVIEFMGDTYQVPQIGAEYSFTCSNYPSPWIAYAESNGEHFYPPINENDYRTITTDWFKAEIKGNKLKITFEPNETEKERPLELNVTSGDAFYVFRFNQRAKQPEGDPDEVPVVGYGTGYIVDGVIYCPNTSNGTIAAVFPANESIVNISIPQQIELKGNLYTIEHLQEHAFSGLKQLTTVSLPNSITDIGASVFTGCDHLQTINLPNNLTEIKIYTFQFCKSLTSITLPAGLTFISNYAFNGCESLESITFPATLEAIGQEAFQDCYEIKSLDIPEGVTSIGLDAFRNCKNLTTVTIPRSVTNFGFPFTGCDAITTLHISCRDVSGTYSNSLTTLMLGEGVVSIYQNAFAGCTKLKSVEFPNTTNSIGEKSFYGCSSLSSIVLPESLYGIADNAFVGCTSLKSVTCLASTPPSYPVSYPAFDTVTLEQGTLYVPSASVDAYKSTDGWKEFKNIVGID